MVLDSLQAVLVLSLKAGLITAFVVVLYGLIYQALRGHFPKKLIMQHKNIYFRLITITLIAGLPAFLFASHVSLYIVLPIGLLTALVLQFIADDYIS